MADKLSSITDLPLDILVLVFPYLDAKSFLALCSTCKALHQPSIQLDPAYWSFATRSAFRVPNQPVVQHDGVRWQKMYRRLLTQSHVFTWGSNTHSRLGHSYEQRLSYNPTGPRMLPRPGRIRYNFNSSCATPTEMEDTRSLGVIADMQCGGWSTTLLTSKGSLHTAGVLDGQSIMMANERIQPLRFPEGYPVISTEAQYSEPAIAIRQFSAGRSHVLALSDNGRIWSWYNVKESALQVKFTIIDIKEVSSTTASDRSSYGEVKQVVAGWSRSSAYVEGPGILVWDPVQRDNGEEATDTMLVLENTEVPKTSYRRVKDTHGESEEQRALGDKVGAVLNYIILEHFVVFVTDIGKVFCGRFGSKNKVDTVLEIQQLRAKQGEPLDVQGSFRRFAIFRNNEVITTTQDYLQAAWNAQRTDPEQCNVAGLQKIPALQDKGVISVAFGDYHFLALHSNGSITSYGTENQACGALGLGEDANGTGHARGIVYDRFSHNGQLVPHAYTTGRQVWFDTRKKDWISHVVHGKTDPDENTERRLLFHNDPNVHGEVSEWLEQEGRTWEQDGGEDGLGAYFALRVSAAGWHSGALVLVNQDLAGKEPAYEWENKSFPRLRLSDGSEMPGNKNFDEWKEGRPEWQLDVLT